jgi:hypothetical protein
MIALITDHQQVLAWRGVAIDNGITYRSTALDDSPAHDRYVVIHRTGYHEGPTMGGLRFVALGHCRPRRCAQGPKVTHAIVASPMSS